VDHYAIALPAHNAVAGLLVNRKTGYAHVATLTRFNRPLEMTVHYYR
jgi:hypothetical protein